MASDLESLLETMEVPPSASVDREGGQPRFVITFSPATHLAIDSRVSFEVRVPLSYPSVPPLVACLDVAAAVRAGAHVKEALDDSGKVTLRILNFDGGWNRSYTLSHVNWALHVLLKREGVPTVTKLPSSSPLALGSIQQEAGHFGRRGRRQTMEDATCAFPKLSSSHRHPLGFYAVFDGHGGAKMAEYASKHLHHHLLEGLEAGLPMPMALHSACVATDEGFTSMMLKAGGEKDQSGTTACIVVLEGATAYTANLGDSRAVLCRGGSAVPLTTDQKASSPSEVARIIAADGFVINNRVLGYLAVARALGDSAFKPGPGQPALVSTHPDVTEAPLDDRDEFLVVACDGLFDVMSNEEVVDFARPLLGRGASPTEVASQLSQHAIDRGSCDNVSVVVVKLGRGPRLSPASLRHAPAPRSSSSVSTASPHRSRKGSTTGEIPAMLLALVAESEKAGPTSNPFSRSFGSTDKAAAERTKIVHESGAYSAGAGAGAGAGADPDGMALELPGGRYARGARSPVVARAARNRAGSREAPRALVTPTIANMSEERKRALSREGARLLEKSGVIGTPTSARGLSHTSSSRGSFRRTGASNTLDDGSDLMEFLMDDNNFDTPLSR